MTEVMFMQKVKVRGQFEFTEGYETKLEAA